MKRLLALSRKLQSQYEKYKGERVKQLSITISNIMILKNKVSPFHESFTNRTLQNSS